MARSLRRSRVMDVRSEPLSLALPSSRPLPGVPASAAGLGDLASMFQLPADEPKALAGGTRPAPMAMPTAGASLVVPFGGPFPLGAIVGMRSETNLRGAGEALSSSEDKAGDTRPPAIAAAPSTSEGPNRKEPVIASLPIPTGDAEGKPAEAPTASTVIGAAPAPLLSPPRSTSGVSSSLPSQAGAPSGQAADAADPGPRQPPLPPESTSVAAADPALEAAALPAGSPIAPGAVPNLPLPPPRSTSVAARPASQADALPAEAPIAPEAGPESTRRPQRSSDAASAPSASQEDAVLATAATIVVAAPRDVALRPDSSPGSSRADTAPAIDAEPAEASIEADDPVASTGAAPAPGPAPLFVAAVPQPPAGIITDPAATPLVPSAPPISAPPISAPTSAKREASAAPAGVITNPAATPFVPPTPPISAPTSAKREASAAPFSAPARGSGGAPAAAIGPAPVADAPAARAAGVPQGGLGFAPRPTSAPGPGAATPAAPIPSASAGAPGLRPIEAFVTRADRPQPVAILHEPATALAADAPQPTPVPIDAAVALSPPSDLVPAPVPQGAAQGREAAPADGAIPARPETAAAPAIRRKDDRGGDPVVGPPAATGGEGASEPPSSDPAAVPRAVAAVHATESSAKAVAELPEAAPSASVEAASLGSTAPAHAPPAPLFGAASAGTAAVAAPHPQPGAHPVVTGVPVAAVPVEIGLRSLAGINRFDIRLDPEDLGQIDVRLDISEGGTVKAQIIVETPEAFASLHRDTAMLERALEQAGLRTGDEGVSLSLRQQGQGEAGHHRGEGREPPTSSRGAQPDAPDSRAAPDETPRRYSWSRASGVDRHI